MNYKEYKTIYDKNAIGYPHLDNFSENGPHWHRTSFYLQHINPWDRVLDCGCANGGLARYLTEEVGCEVSAFDISILNSQRTKGNALKCNSLAATIEQLPFKDESFDVVIVGEILEHVLNIDISISECVRVLKKGGTLLTSTPRNKDSDNSQHIRYVGKRELKELIEGITVFDNTHSWLGCYQKEDKIMSNILEQDVIMGTFTHRTTYLDALIESISIHLPNIEFIVQLSKNNILGNMTALWNKFKKSGRRFWIFLDDDIEFLEDDTVKKAVENLVKYKLGMIGVYSTFDPNYKLGSKELSFQTVGWIPGYFQMVDSWKVGHISPDQDLPDGNTAIDTSYCVSIHQAGYEIGLSPSVVYHTKKDVWMNKEAADKTNEYLTKKWGDFYYRMCSNFPGVI